MYQDFYKLRALPFQLSPDPSFYFDSRCHHRALAYFRFGLHKGEGFLVITGEVGAGKTILAGTLFRELEDRNDVAVGHIVTSQLQADDLLRMVASSFGVSHQNMDKASILESLQRFLVDCTISGRKALLVIDDAQDLRADALEELRILSNLQLKGKALLQIFLLGQAEFRPILNAPEMEHFRQRIITSYHLGPLSEKETQEYIEHRLKVAGWENDPAVTPEAYRRIQEYSSGLPRKINTICDRVFLLGYLEELHEITASVVQQVIDELKEETFSEMIDNSLPATSRTTGEAKDAQGKTEGESVSEMGREIEAIARRLILLEDSIREKTEVSGMRPDDRQDAGKEIGTLQTNESEFQSSQGVVNFEQQVVRRRRRKRTKPSPCIMCVVGARPNFMKIAPIMRAFENGSPRLCTCLVHTGQHYDKDMNESFFSDLGIRDPDIELNVGSGSHAVQTALIMQRFEPVLEEEAPAAILVVGDVNSTIACALVAAKRGVPVLHVEAGLRSNDRTMPEEINRVLTDQISDLLFTTEPDARDNLLLEGIDSGRIHYVGNVMIDNMQTNLERAVSPEALLREKKDSTIAVATNSPYALLTLHRPSNVDDLRKLEQILNTILEVSRLVPVLFPMHPRTRQRIKEYGLEHLLIIEEERLVCMPPLGYLEILGLMQNARLVMTDSGGMQEETTALGVPCLTLRDNTERPITIDQGTNTLVGSDHDLILKEVTKILDGKGKVGKTPEYWDGNAAQRIKSALLEWLSIREPAVKGS